MDNKRESDLDYLCRCERRALESADYSNDISERIAHLEVARKYRVQIASITATTMP